MHAHVLCVFLSLFLSFEDSSAASLCTYLLRQLSACYAPGIQKPVREVKERESGEKRQTGHTTRVAWGPRNSPRWTNEKGEREREREKN